MPKASFRVQTTIYAKPEVVFAYVTDLTKHGEWAANPVQIKAISPGSVMVGSRYHSTAQVKGLVFTTELRVTAYQPPSGFAFTGEDTTGRFEHQFAFRPYNHGTRVERQVNFALTWPQWLMFEISLYPVRLPAARKALNLLKARLERAGS